MAYGKSTNRGAFQKGFRLLDGDWLNKAFEKMLEGGIGRAYGIVAKAGGTKAAAVQLGKSLNQVDTVATAADSVLLPKAIAGSIILVTNNGANSMASYGQGTDTINGQPTANAYNVAAGKTVLFVCHQVGKWFALLSA